MREAHGNWAAAELAVEVCADINNNRTQEDQKTQMNPLDLSKEESVDDSSVFDANPRGPYFAHLAMCKDKKGKELAPIQPPLGWVLSKWTQDNFRTLLKTCGNEEQLPQLETALRGRPQQGGAQQGGAQPARVSDNGSN